MTAVGHTLLVTGAAPLLTLLTTTLAFAVPEAPLQQDEHTTWLAHFDGPGADADFAVGEPKGLVEGELGFEEGSFGKALKFGKTQIQYRAAKNISPLKGTAEFWVMDLDFDHSSWTDHPIIFSLSGHGQGAEEGRSYLLRCFLTRNWMGVQVHLHGSKVGKDPGAHLLAEDAALPSGRWQY